MNVRNLQRLKVDAAPVEEAELTSFAAELTSNAAELTSFAAELTSNAAVDEKATSLAVN